MNQTACPSVFDSPPHCLRPTDVPFYYSFRRSLIVGFSDHALALAAPIFAYWFLSLTFHYLDTSGWKWLEKYRIHDSVEVRSRNLASRSQVVWAVLLQQVIQTLLGLVWMSEEASRGVNHGEKMDDIIAILEPLMRLAVGAEVSRSLLPSAVYFVYWWVIPSFQFLAAMFFIDTWQYFLHRLMHANMFLYKQFHSVHHRLYVPYAFGSLYNHPVEGLLLDSLGAVIAESLTRMTTRQAMFLFSFSTLKTVDDHCGYKLPFDPLQLITGNNADYHDIHHQVIGVKSNFAQPFFIHWDVLLGTRMTRHDIELRRQKSEDKTR